MARVEKRVIGEEPHPAPRCCLQQFLSLRGLFGERLLDEHVLSGGNRLHRHGVMEARRRRDRD
jgi:hypothetical protein